MSATEGREQADRYRRSAGIVSAALGLSGVLLYAFFALASHELSRDEYGQIVVLWLIVIGLVSILFRPVEQLLARELAVARATGTAQGPALRSAALIALGLVGTFVVVALALRGPLEDDVLGGDAFLYWCLVAGVVTFGGDYYLRGVLAGRGRFDLYAVQLVTECTVLVATGALGALGVLGGVSSFAFAIAIAPLLGLTVALVARLSGRVRGERSEVTVTDGAGGLSGHGGFAAAVLAVMVCEQVLINAGPLFVRATEGVAVAGFMFNVLMVARAPAALFQGIAASLLPHLAGSLREEGGGERDYHDAIRSTLIGVLAFTAATVAGLLLVGPEAMQLVFGDKFSYDREDLILVAVGMGFLLAAATLTQACFARGRAAVAAVAWGLAATAFILYNLTDALDPTLRVETGFLGATAALAIALYVIERPASDPGESLEPDSADALQARLAAADELA